MGMGDGRGLRLGLDAIERLCGRVKIDFATYFWLLQVGSSRQQVDSRKVGYNDWTSTTGFVHIHGSLRLL